MKTQMSSQQELPFVEYGYVSRIRLVKEPSRFSPIQCTTSGAAYDFAVKLFSDDLEIYESFYAIYLNRANLITDYVKISQGGITGTLVDAKLILKYGIETLASGVIFAHNHPSGNITPSSADTNLTKRLAEQLKFFDIQVLDHIIVTKDNYYSFADHGLLNT